jgi:phage tail protein X
MTYTTVQGDTFDMIAYKTLGDCNLTDKLIDANIEYKDYLIFPSGVVLNIPDLETKVALSDLPPWKRVSG